MKNKLPVHIENRELPVDRYMISKNRTNSYGYVNVLYLASIIITIVSVVTIIVVRNR